MIGEAIGRIYFVDILRQNLGRSKLVLYSGFLSAISATGGLLTPYLPETIQVPFATIFFCGFGLGTSPWIPIAYSSSGHGTDNTQAALGSVAFCTDSGSIAGPFVIGTVSLLMGGLQAALLVATGIISCVIPISSYLPHEKEIFQLNGINISDDVNNDGEEEEEEVNSMRRNEDVWP